MLTSFFGKSNPVNYLILGIFIFLFYFIAIFFGTYNLINPILFLEYGFYLLLCIMTMLLLDFIIRKNALTKTNTYAILYFSCFLAMLPMVFLNHEILLANFFILLAFRRIMSLRSEIKVEKKIFDASAWITVAALFQFWCVLFFVPLYISIIQQQRANYKLMLIPVTGFFGILILKTAFHLLFFNSFGWFYEWKAPISFDFSSYNSLKILMPVAVIATFLIWTSIYRITQIPTIAIKEKTNYILMFFVVAASLSISLASPQKTGAELLFIFAPSAIIIANYIENVTEFWFKESLLWLVVVFPFLMVIL